jgi:hypothetical protein
MNDQSKTAESQVVSSALGAHEDARWHAHATVRKYWGEVTEAQVLAGELPEPYEVVEADGNLLLTAGITLMLNLLIGAGGTTFANASCYLGVGDSSTAESAAQTDLQAATNKVRKQAAGTYPQVATNVLTVQAVFTTSDGNFAWAEWGIFNASSSGTMLNRKVASLGTKTSAASWTFTVTVTIS